MAIFTRDDVGEYEGLDRQAPMMVAAGWTHAFDDHGEPVPPAPGGDQAAADPSDGTSSSGPDGGDGGDAAGPVVDPGVGADAVHVSELPSAVIEPAPAGHARRTTTRKD